MRSDRDLENHMLLGNNDYFKYYPTYCSLCGCDEVLTDGFCDRCLEKEKTIATAKELGGFGKWAYEYNNCPLELLTISEQEALAKEFCEENFADFILYLKENR